jgi:PAS domain S-box-containing protein
MYWSDEVYRIFGRIPRKSDSSYTEILSYVHPDDREYVDNAVKRALKGETFAIDHRIVLASGEEHAVHSLGEVIFDEENTPVRMKGIVQDITKNKRAEDALRKSERRYRLLFENMLDGFACCRMLYNEFGHPVDYFYLETNSAFEQLTGLKEVTGKRVTEVIPGIKEQHPELFDTYSRVALTGQPERFEIEFKPLGIWLSISVYSTEREYFVALFENITERKQEEHRILRYNRILEGINQIFSDVMQAKTVDEMGNACLSVALEVTGSQICFVGEIDADGLLHDIAVSDMGWNQCLMYDKTGHRRPPGDFILHGLYGSVIDSGKSFFINNPQSHPDSIGLPHGHPPLTSFLGVPFVLDGKTMGMFAVANREGGYNYEQQEDLKAIAPAVVQALQRKKEEQERKQVEEMLRLSEEKFSKAFATNPAAISITHLEDGLIMDVNDIWLTTFGYSRDEVIETSLSLQLWPTPGDRDRFVQELREKGPFHSRKLMFLRKSGEPFTALASAVTLTVEVKRWFSRHGWIFPSARRRRRRCAKRRSENVSWPTWWRRPTCPSVSAHRMAGY